MTRSMWLVAGLLMAGPVWAGTVKASSESVDREGVRHLAAMAFDGELQTAWAEAEPGGGEASWIELRFDKPIDIAMISIWPGDLRKGERTAKESPRPKLVTITLDTEEGPITVQDAIPDVGEAGIQRKDVHIEGKARGIRVTVDESYGGYLSNDCFIAEIAVNFTDTAAAPVQAIRTWMASEAGQKLESRHRDEVVALFDKIDQSPFGDREAFQQLVDWAANGAPWVQDKARREVPVGWRVQAIPPDELAVQALLKLKDANAIPGLTMAALRTSGKEQRQLQSKVAYFEAWSELNGGPRRNLPVWGATGWEKGALQSFGEPLAVEQGQFGDVYVADVGNHRVTVFGPDGTTRATWGLGSPTVTDTWFGKTRRYYPSGSEPSKKAGGFVNPVDVAVIPGRSDEQVVVLDATGRVQWFDSQGKPLKELKVAVSGDLSPGVGGEGHLVLLKGKVAVVWGNEVVVTDEEGLELSRWKIEEGAPIVAEGLPNGKLLLGFRREVVEYNSDGFRHGVVIDEEDLPQGYEAYDLTLDEANKLWAVTDNGWAVKFKRPGKVDWMVRWSERSVDVPRMAVHDGMLFVVAKDEVKRIDALELHAEAELDPEPEE